MGIMRESEKEEKNKEVCGDEVGNEKRKLLG